uniref:ATP synthase complex subunit 8 n=1 Tax=Ultragryllacris pulchra rubricapitis TaxID=2992769 RepID=A0A9E7VCK9_9ORTH|nr:ATP synthase F0 subunit 8 [Ultragryllacris pulchra rubricapitis]
MPQMAPLNWLSLFIMFSLTLILFAMINYFYFKPKLPLPSKNLISNLTLNWKW